MGMVRSTASFTLRLRQPVVDGEAGRAESERRSGSYEGLDRSPIREPMPIRTTWAEPVLGEQV